MARILLVNLSSLPIPGNEPIFPLGVRCIEHALSRAGHHVCLMDFVEQPEKQADLAWAGEQWDVIGFAIRNIDPIDLACDGHVDAYEAFVAKVRQAAGPGALLVGGGPGYSLFAEGLTRRLGLHVGVRGPGEAVMLDIAAAPERYAGGVTVIDGRAYDGFTQELLRHPTGLMRAYSVGRDAMIGVETRRKTCFQRCVYCPYAYITGQNAGDLKPIDLLRDEIAGIHDAGFRRIFFTDGIFNSGITFAKQIVRMLSDQAWPGLTWSAYFAARPFDDEFAGLLRSSGVESVVVSPDSLDNALMQRLGKNFDLQDMGRFLDICRRQGLRPLLNVVFGGPGETRQTVANSSAYINAALAEHEVSLHIGYRILPHTALSAETGLGEPDLLYPTYYPFDPDIFQWMMHDLEPRFMTPTRLMSFMAGRASMRRMGRIQGSASQAPGCAHAAAKPSAAPAVVALSRIRLPDGVSAAR